MRFPSVALGSTPGVYGRMSIPLIDCLCDGDEGIPSQKADRLKLLFSSSGGETIAQFPNGAVNPRPACRW